MFENLKEVIIVKVSYEEVMRKRRRQSLREALNFAFLLGFLALLGVVAFLLGLN